MRPCLCVCGGDTTLFSQITKVDRASLLVPVHLPVCICVLSVAHAGHFLTTCCCGMVLLQNDVEDAHWRKGAVQHALPYFISTSSPLQHLPGAPTACFHRDRLSLFSRLVIDQAHWAAHLNLPVLVLWRISTAARWFATCFDFQDIDVNLT